MSEQDVQTLSGPGDARALKKAAINIAKGTDPAEHKLLQEKLGTTSFLNKLDDETAYQKTYRSLRLSKIFKTLMDNDAPVAKDSLLALIPLPDYQDEVLRMQLLVHGLATVKPSPPEAVAYWDAKSQPGSPLTFDVAEAIHVNQSLPALELLETKTHDPRHDEDLKTAWMQQLLLPIRNDVPLLECHERLVHSGLSEPLKISIVEVLFDYKPDEWYRDCEVPEPPPRDDASQEARESLGRIGRYALNSLPLEPKLSEKVEKELDDIGQ